MDNQHNINIFILLIFSQFGIVMAEECTNILAAVLISIAGTLAVVAIILLIIFLCYKKSKKGKHYYIQHICIILLNI